MGKEPESIFEEWKSNMEDILKKKGNRLDGTQCPKCQEPAIRFDKKTARIYCTACGFEEYLIQ